MFVCKICGNELKAGQAFCPKCGADVVDNYETVCPACGTKNGAGSRYCAKCGGILSVMRKPICAVCGVQNLPGAKYCVSCGAPVVALEETHSDKDVLDARKAKVKLDMMERERMAAVDREIAAKRERMEEERVRALREVEDYRGRSDDEFRKKSAMLDQYRDKLNELGSEDVELLKKMSSALKDYSVYYADPYSQIDEDDINGETYVCPACGTINPLNAVSCTHCGRSKARATLLLAKGKIKQSHPIKRKQEKIEPPSEELTTKKVPTFDEFTAEESDRVVKAAEPIKTEAKQNEPPADFSGRGQSMYGYPYPPVYPPMYAGGYGAPILYNQQTGEPYQMPPIVQPVAFVPYVTQEQPLMQYSPTEEPQRVQTPPPTVPVSSKPAQQPRKK